MIELGDHLLIIHQQSSSTHFQKPNASMIYTNHSKMKTNNVAPKLSTTLRPCMLNEQQPSATPKD